MKELARFFGRHYSAVNVEDDQQLHGNGRGGIYASNLQCANATSNDKRKSLKAKHSVNASGILNSFFNERSSNKSSRSPKCAFLYLVIGIVAITAAILVKIIHPYDLIFRWKLTMSDNGEIFNLWAKPPVDLYLKVYLFNITNAEAFLAGRERMNVEEVGPYVYKEIMTHENVTFNANGTMSVIPSHPLVWQEHLSEGRSEDDEVVMLNIAMLAISHLTADKPFFIRMGLNSLFLTQNSQPIVRMTAKEFMFGYASTLTSLGNTFLPNWIHFDKVGLVDRMMDFGGDYETFYTGHDDASISGLYATYRGSTNLPQWSGESCSNIEFASDGVKFPSFLKPDQPVKFFRKSMCRAVNLVRADNELITSNSLSGYRYVFEDNTLDNGRVNEKNKCYCRNGNCQPVGLADVTDCYYGFPISLSFPHFIEGDPGLRANITGMSPNKERHSSAFIIEPESGLPLTLSVKVQINMHFDDLSAFSRVKPFSHLTTPMLWFEIMMHDLPQDLDTRFNFYLNILPIIEPIGFWGGLIFGLALLIYAVTRATLHLTSLTQNTQLLDQNYAKANLLQVSTNGVYNPCEMKLMHSNEKSKKILCNSGHPTDEPYAELQNSLKPQVVRKSSTYALEMEPPLSSTDASSCDEGNDSDTATLTLSHNSSSSCCGLNDNNNVKFHLSNTTSDDDEDDDKDESKTSVSLNSSGYRSSVADSSESVADEINDNCRSPGDTSSTSIKKC